MKNALLQSLDDHFLDGLKFCSLVYKIFEKVRETPEGLEGLRMRRGKCKKLVEELLPICKYIQGKYTDQADIFPSDGKMGIKNMMPNSVR